MDYGKHVATIRWQVEKQVDKNVVICYKKLATWEAPFDNKLQITTKLRHATKNSKY